MIKLVMEGVGTRRRSEKGESNPSHLELLWIGNMVGGALEAVEFLGRGLHGGQG